MHFDLMTSGLALLAATLAFTLASLRDGASRAWATTILCLCAVVLTYPLLFPPAFMIAVASVAARPVEAWRRGEGLRLDRATLGRALTLIAPLIVFFGYYKLISSGDGGAVFADLTSIRHAIRDAVISTALFLPLLGLAAWRLSRAPDPARLALFAAGIALAGLFVFVDLPAGNEYKFLVAAMIIAIPLCAEQAALLLDQIHPAAARFAPAAAASVIFLASAPTLAQRHIPWDDDHKGVALTEGGFHLAPPSAPEFAWMRAIRDQTPSDTVILHPDLSTPVTVMTERSSYLAPVSRPERTGYSTQDRNLLANIRGYGPAVVDHRALVRGEIYQGASETEFAAISMELAELHRPIAVFAPASNSYVHWLANQHRGHAIWNGNSDTVWLVTPQELVTAHL
jgi:hypothetical protein